MNYLTQSLALVITQQMQNSYLKSSEAKRNTLEAEMVTEALEFLPVIIVR